MAEVIVNQSPAVIVVEATANGQTLFAFDFLVLKDTQLYAIHSRGSISTHLTAVDDFTVLGVGVYNGGVIDISLSGVAILDGDFVTIVRDIPIERLTDYVNDLRSSVINRELDTIFMILQEHRRDLQRALMVPFGEIPPVADDLFALMEAATQAALLAQQYAAEAAMVSGVNVPIYASRMSVAGSSIAAGVKKIHAQYYNPSYAVLGTLHGGADYGRMSKADIDALGLPASGYVRSLDAFMPDGSTDAINGGYWVIVSDILRPQMFGVRADGVTLDTVALQACVTYAGILKRAVFAPAATYLTGLITLPSNVHIYGEFGTIFQANVEDVGIFISTQKLNIHLHTMLLIGANGSDHSALMAALTFNRTSDVHVHDVVMTNWPDRCIHYAGNTATNEVAKNAVFERCMMSGAQAPARFTGSCIYIADHTENVTVQDCDMEGYNGGVFCIDPLGLGKTHVRGHKILNNRIRNMIQYGIIAYFSALITNVAGAVDNGAGLVRLTVPSHNYVTGDQVRIEAVTGTTEANGAWLITVISANTFDLDGSVFANAYVSGGTSAAVNPCDIEIAGNVIEDIDGAPTVQNGNNGNFGAGIYCVGGCGINIHDNTVRRANMGTTTSSLAPGGIGCSAQIGDVRIVNNVVEDCAWHGIYVPSAPFGGVQIGLNKVRRVGRTGIYTFDSGNVVIAGNEVEGSRTSALSRGIQVGSNTLVKNITVSDNIATGFVAARLLVIDNASDINVTANKFVNEGLASLFMRPGEFTNCDGGVVSGNVFNGKALTNNALYIDDVKNVDFYGNRSAATDGGNACVLMLGDCTGTVYHASNSNSFDRMHNGSTGGKMHTRAPTNASGGLARRIGDTIENTAPSGGSVAKWYKVADSVGAADWKTLTLSA